MRSFEATFSIILQIEFISFLYLFRGVIRINVFTAKPQRSQRNYFFFSAETRLPCLSLRWRAGGRKEKVLSLRDFLFTFARIPVSRIYTGICRELHFSQKVCCLLFSVLSTENNKKIILRVLCVSSEAGGDI